MVIVVMMGGMAACALAWGQFATYFSIPEALRYAAAGLSFSVLLTWNIKLIHREGMDLTPSMHWAAPVVDKEPEPDRGLVLITLRYRVNLLIYPSFCI